MDDEQIIRNNSGFLKDMSNIPEAFRVDAFIQKEASSLYRPLQTITYIIDYSFVEKEDSLKPFHVTNLILDTLVVLLLFNVLLRLKIERVTAFLLVLLYSVHPLLTAAVAWIPSRGDLLLGLFTLLSLITFLNYKEDKKTYNIFLHIIIFFLALLSKETAVFIPVMLLGMDLIVHKAKLLSKENIIFSAIWGSEIIIFLLIRKFGLNAPPLSSEVLGIKPFLENLPVIPITAGKFFIPQDLTTYAMFKTYSAIIGCAVIAGGFFLIYKNKKNRMPAIMGWLWFFLFTIPPMIFKHQLSRFGTDYLEHRAFLPAMGLLIFTAVIVNGYFSGKSSLMKRPGIIILYSGIFILFSYTTYNHSLDYKDHMAFANASIESCDRNAIGYSDRATARIGNGEYTEALIDLDKSIALCPNNPQAYNNRGVIYLNMNQPEKAYGYISTSIFQDSNFTIAYLTRGSADIRLNKLKEAVDDFSFVIKKNPEITAAYYDRAVAFEMLNEFGNAVQDYSVVLKQEPGNAEVMNKIEMLRKKL